MNELNSNNDLRAVEVYENESGEEEMQFLFPFVNEIDTNIQSED